MKFEWDARKAARNRHKHGVSFEEAEEVFGDAFALTGDDVAHAFVEKRERTIGRSGKGRLLIVISTRRGEMTRIISARKATTREAQAYEKETEKKLRGTR